MEKLTMNELREVAEIIESIGATSARTGKEMILKNNKDNEVLKDVLVRTLNPYNNYKISNKMFGAIVKKYPILDESVNGLTIHSMLEELASHNITEGIRAKVGAVYCSLFMQEPKVADLFKKMVLKDLRAGITEKTVNKIWKGLIPSFNVQLAKSYADVELEEDERIYLTKKLDGIRAIVIYTNENVKIFSRQGKPITGLNTIEKEVKKLCIDQGFKNIVFDGELLLFNFGGYDSGELYRKTVNVVNSDSIDKQGVQFHMFDRISLHSFNEGEDDTPYSIRRSWLNRNEDSIKKLSLSSLVVVPVLYEGEDHTVIPQLLEKVEQAGGEGLMINRDEGYQCKRTANLLKVKSFSTADVRVIGVIEGDKSNVGKLGAITIEFIHNDEIHTCNVGSGFTLKERELYWQDPSLIMGKIVEIGYFEVSQNKNSEGYSLRFPTFKHLRQDKDEISMH